MNSVVIELEAMMNHTIHYLRKFKFHSIWTASGLYFSKMCLTHLNRILIHLCVIVPCYPKINNVLSLNDADRISRRQVTDVSGSSTSVNHTLADEEDVFLKKKGSSRSRKYHLGLSSSDAEIDYRRGSLREGKGDFACHN